MLPRILLLGKNGQLGWEFQRTLATLGEVAAYDWPEIDFAQPEALRALIRQLKPQIIVNAAAYTAVDRAESEPEKCAAINALAPALLAEEARASRAALLHFSTDYVYDGQKGSAYREEDVPHPLNTYGQTKLAGDQAIQQTGGAYWIFRTSWVYSLRRDSFVTKVLEWARRQKTLRIVHDQTGGPTWCRLLAEVSTQALAQGRQDHAGWVAQTAGIYHLAGSGWASRLEWARMILELDPHKEGQAVTELLPAETSEFPTPAVRPLAAAMDCSRFEETFGLRLPRWQTALRLLMEQ
jgi:dTDP-4-dehydrorhamnose reductase